MIIKCDENPDDLIGEIGNPNFSICDEDWDEVYRHPKHPHVIRIIDCEFGTTIDVEGEMDEDTKRIALALCTLLNQDYRIQNE